MSAMGIESRWCQRTGEGLALWQIDQFSSLANHYSKLPWSEERCLVEGGEVGDASVP
jgi:hypothetical protein